MPNSISSQRPLDVTVASAVYTETSDAPANTSTPYSISVGDTFVGNLSYAGDNDWIAVELTAGLSYTFEQRGSPTSDGTLPDPYIRLYSASSVQVAYNDDGGVGYNSRMTFTPSTSGTYYIQAGSYASNYSGTYEVDFSVELPPEPGTVADFADQLINGYWNYTSRYARSFDVSGDREITVDIDALTTSGQQLARWALESWTNVTGITFTEVSSGAQITFDDNDSGAYSYSSVSGSTITSSHVNVSTAWLSSYGTTMDSYSLQTYIHEIGHAIGLGHAGNYNGSATFGDDNVYINDSWQMSIMSYFSQTENSYIDASYAFVVTPMIADIAAVHSMYGYTANSDNTVWGANSTLTDYMGDFFGQLFGEDTRDTSILGSRSTSFTIWDAGGTDTIDFSPDTQGLYINMEPGSISNTLGYRGNMIIAENSYIENFIGGSGADTVNGNDLDNLLEGGAGADSLIGFDGNDTIIGGAGADTLIGSNGQDLLDYTGSSAAVSVNLATGAGSGGDASGDTVSNFEDIAGTSYDDTLTGDGGANRLMGGDGEDLLAGGAGADYLHGGSGSDRVDYGASSSAVTVDLEAGTGSGGDAEGDTLIRIEEVSGSGYGDNLSGSSGDDMLLGAGGDDTLIGGAGSDIFDGGAGQDLLDYTASTAGVMVDLTRGRGRGGDAEGDRNANAEDVAGTAFNDTLIGSSAENRLLGGDGFDFFAGDAGADFIHGGGDQDRVNYGASSTAVRVSLDTGAGYTGDAAGDVLIRIEELVGSDYNDTLEGSTGRNKFWGGDGDDLITANDGPDVLYGEAGNDTLDAGEGRDIIIGGTGDDSITGGTGNDIVETGTGSDILVYEDGHGGDYITDFDVASDTLDLTAITGINSFADLNAEDGRMRREDGVFLHTSSGDFVFIAGVTITEIETATIVN